MMRAFAAALSYHLDMAACGAKWSCEVKTDVRLLYLNRSFNNKLILSGANQ